MSNKLSEIFQSRGMMDANDYARSFGPVPGLGTVDRYLRGGQSPLTSKGNWRKAAKTIAGALSMSVEQVFPEYAEQREQLLDEISVDDFGGLRSQGILQIVQQVRCPKDKSSVDLTACKTCKFFSKVEESNLICKYRGE